MFPIRRLLLIVFLSLFAAPAFGQPTATPTPIPTNPHVADCGLPTSGPIIESVTYTLDKDCEQKGTLEIRTADTPNITLTINGNNKTISNGTGADWYMSFLIVDSKGALTVVNTDTSASPNVKVVIKNVTFDGKGLFFGRHNRRIVSGDGTEHFERAGIGSWILAEGTLEMENVTFTNGKGSWLRAQGKASLKNVLFKDSKIWSWAISDITRGVLFVDDSASVTLNNAVFRDIERTAIVIDKGGRLNTTGCLSFTRIFTHRVYHSEVDSGYYGTWTDSSTGACSGTIGNIGSAVVGYSPTELPCSLPEDAVIDKDTIYTLTEDCVCLKRLVVAAGVTVTINGNDHEIRGCPGYHYTLGERNTPRRATFVISGENAHLKITNTDIYGLRVRNWGGNFTLGNSTIAEALVTPLQNYGWMYLHDSTFKNNQGWGTTEGNVYDGYPHFRMGRALFRDNMFSNNIKGGTALYTKGSGTSIILCGENEVEFTPEEGEEVVELPLFIVEQGGAVVGCSDDVPQPVSPSVECVPEQVALPANKMLGAIGVIIYKQKCPAVMEIWEILPNSQGQFALEVSQSDVVAVAEGVVACSSNGRAAVRVGLPEPVLRQIVHSQAYQAVSPRKARDILVSMGPNSEGKVSHMVIDNALDGSVLGIVSTHSDQGPCQGANLSDIVAVAAPLPQPTAVPYASSVAPQPAREDGSIIHVVQSGDTIWQIGIAYDVHPYKIISLNQLDQLRNRGRYIFPGQELLIRAAE